MTQEEKVKRYDEALEEAKKWHKSFVIGQNYPATDIKVSYECMFPELKESEDEKIRKSIVNLVIKSAQNGGMPLHKWESQQMLAWLEKQGQQKTDDKVEPKFHEGEWITNGDYTWEIVEVKPLDYILQSQDGNIVDDTISHVDEQFHSFTIEDAKDGDVLSYRNGKWIFILKGIIDKDSFEYYTLWSTVHNDLTINDSACSLLINSIYPATKEQRDLLSQKMKEAGYTFDFEKKELKKIVTSIFHIGDRVRYKGHSCDGVITEITDTDYICGKSELPISTQDKLELVEQKPTWSKEDERYLSYAIHAVEDMLGDNGKNIVAWLKSLKDRYTWKPSDKQMNAFDAVLVYNPPCSNECRNHLISLYNELKKLREE